MCYEILVLESVIGPEHSALNIPVMVNERGDTGLALVADNGTVAASLLPI
jgi:hypothetical protein